MTSTIREVVLVPNRQWGGEGLLGCVFGCVLRNMYAIILKMICLEDLAYCIVYPRFLATANLDPYLRNLLNLQSMRNRSFSSPQMRRQTG